MNRLQSLRADTRVLRDAEPHARRSTRSKVIRTIPYAHPVFTRAGPGRPGAPRRDQRPEPHALLRRLLGLGLPRGRRRERRCASPRRWGRPHDRTARSTRARSATAASRCASTSSATASRWPTSTSTSCPHLLGGRARRAPARASCASAAATTSATRHAARRRRCGRSCASARARAGGPDPPAHARCARSATASTRSASTTASHPTASTSRRSSPRSPTRRGASATPTCSAATAACSGELDKALHVSPFMGMDAALRRGAPRARRRRCRCTSRATRGRRARVRRHAGAAPPRRYPALRGLPRYPALAARLALIYGHAVALKLKGVPVQPHPAR